jgi:hypothetical protein
LDLFGGINSQKSLKKLTFSHQPVKPLKTHSGNAFGRLMKTRIAAAQKDFRSEARRKSILRLRCSGQAGGVRRGVRCGETIDGNEGVLYSSPAKGVGGATVA